MARESKMTVCKHCGAEIASSAKTCPQCGGKNKKPFFKKWWFWLIIVVAVVAVISGTSGGNGDRKADTKKVGEVSQNNENESSAKGKEDSKSADITGSETSKGAEVEVQSVYHVGDILHDGNMDIVYVASGVYVEDNQFLQPADGKEYIFLTFAFINTSKTSDTSISSFSFECYADGYACDSYYGGDDDLSGTLSAGRSTVGSVYFEVPEDAQGIEIEYETNIFTQKKIIFSFDGDQDSGYVLEKNTTPTDGALKVGETAKSNKLNVTYLSAYTDSSNNMFIVPKDGYHYVTCEFDFENVSNSDIFVSVYSFDCFADGIYCDASYFRDDTISATLSAGRKATGTVTFEVPDDAMLIEVEYLSNYWTSNRIVFDASVN